jgi:hypothetical protein
MVRLLLHTLVRSAAFVALSAAFQQGWITASDDPLGQGLVAFMALATLAAVWGLVDGWWLGVGPLAVVWVAVGLVVAIFLALGSQGLDGLDLQILLSDLATGLVLNLSLVAVPAIFCGALVATLRPPRSAPLS